MHFDTYRGGGRTAFPLGVLAILLSAACSGSGQAAVTQATPYAGERTPHTPVAAARALASPLPAGSVRLAAGPFNDRFVIRGLRWHPGQRPAVTGTLDVTSDVSEFLALTISAAFYDSTGRLVGTRSMRLTPADLERPERSIGQDLNRAPFRLTAPAAAGRATAAVLSVPALVNE